MRETDLKVEYNREMEPVSASSQLAVKNAHVAFEPEDSAEIIVWLSVKYMGHRSLHSHDDRRRMPRD